jgi:Tfp pilus assembly protein PilF
VKTAAALVAGLLLTGCAEKKKDMPSSELYLTERMATVLLQQGNAPEAENAFQRALAQDPDNPEMRNGHGLSLLMMGRSREALPEFDKALALMPGHGSYLNNRGAAKLELGDLAGAEADFLKAYESPLLADRKAALINLGRARLKGGNFSDAEDALTRALKIDPGSYDALMVRGAVREAQKNERGAVEDYLEALRVKPEDLGAMLRVGLGLIALHKEELGRKYLRRVNELAPDSPEAVNARVVLGEESTVGLTPRRPGS